MKHLLILFIALYLLTGCNKEEYGNLKQQIRFTSGQSSQTVKSLKNAQDLKYTQFGNFITSITPTGFIGEIEVVRYYAENESGSYMTLVHKEPNQGEEAVLADFSKNATLSVIPTLNGTNIMENPDGQGSFFKDDVTFKVLWIRMGLKLTIELPEEFRQVNLNQFNKNQKTNRIVTTDVIPLFQAVDELRSFGKAFTIYFGMTENTYIEVDEKDKYFLGNNTLPHIRSSKFNVWTMTPPLPDQTKTIVSTIGFTASDIIQLYAGKDNIAYTSDDVMVFEPKFWERIYVSVSEN